MSEMILNVKALPETLFAMIPTERVKLSQTGNIINLIPLHETTKDECLLLGLTEGSRLTVDEFLMMTREDKILEGLKS